MLDLLIDAVSDTRVLAMAFAAVAALAAQPDLLARTMPVIGTRAYDPSFAPWPTDERSPEPRSTGNVPNQLITRASTGFCQSSALAM